MPKVNVAVSYDCQDQVDDFKNAMARLCKMGAATGRLTEEQLREISHLTNCIDQAIRMAFIAGRDYEREA